MNFFVTGVGGQLGHDVMNELLKRGHEGVGSDIQETYSGVADGSAVTKAPYVALDITDKEAVEKVITEVNPDAVIHCAASRLGRLIADSITLICFRVMLSCSPRASCVIPACFRAFEMRLPKAL